jgi:GNAT superfamily N-acetyltransferase
VSVGLKASPTRDRREDLAVAAVIRPATLTDLDPAMGVVQRAILDLRARHGFTLSMPLGPPRFQRRCLEEDPTGLWVAEADGAVLGFGFSWMCDRFWFLAQLFVEPGGQGAGLGQALLSRTLEQAARRQAENTALITFAYNRASTGLYIRHGMYPREPLYYMQAPASRLRLPDPVPGLEVAPIDASLPPPAWLGRIDAPVLGFQRESHHAMLLAGGATALGFACAGRQVAYAYIAPNGHVGPVAIMPGEDVGAIICAALRAALSGGSDLVSIIMPGCCGPGMASAVACGLRIEEPYVLLAARPFGDWNHYIPANPGAM